MLQASGAAWKVRALNVERAAEGQHLDVSSGRVACHGLVCPSKLAHLAGPTDHCRRATSTSLAPRWCSHCDSLRWPSGGGYGESERLRCPIACTSACTAVPQAALHNLVCFFWPPRHPLHSYQDGGKPAAKLQEYAARKRLRQLPSPLEFFSYLFAAGNLLAGPFFEASDFFDYVQRKVGCWE